MRCLVFYLLLQLFLLLTFLFKSLGLLRVLSQVLLFVNLNTIGDLCENIVPGYSLSLSPEMHVDTGLMRFALSVELAFVFERAVGVEDPLQAEVIIES